jgi:very-short-patch-repair endonuclease/predicted transcriptional regulator of viral defense system
MEGKSLARPVSVDRAIARVASRQHGVITRKQLRDLGLGPTAIDRRRANGRLHAIHAGVYLVGHSALPLHAREMAAVLACGPGAVVSHRSAAKLWALLETKHPQIEVTVARAWSSQRPGIRVYSSVSLERRDVRRVDGIPLTSPARTLVDLAAVLTQDNLERAVAEAERQSLARRHDLVDQLERNRGRRGVAKLRALLALYGGPALTRSPAEARLLRLLRQAGLPPPETNVRVGGYEVDFLWREARFIVEVDGFTYHSTRFDFESDRLRDAELEAQGFRVMRVTWRQLVDDPGAVVNRIARALAT